MKNFSMAVLIVSMGLVSGAGSARAQGPAGAGAGAPTTSSASSSTASHSSHSYNPIKWIKKGPKNSGDPAAGTADHDRNLAARLESQGVLPAGANLGDTCSAFKGRAECVAALHASHNLGLDFNCVKSSVTGVLVSADASGCKQASNGKPASLADAIRALKPDANAKAEAKNAEKQAEEDLKS